MLRDLSGTFWKPKVGGEKCVYRDRLKSGCWAKLVAKRGIWYWTKNLLVNALVASSHGTATTSETVKSVLQPENGDRLVTFKVKFLFWNVLVAAVRRNFYCKGKQSQFPGRRINREHLQRIRLPFNLLVTAAICWWTKWIWVQHPLCFHLATAGDLANCLGNTDFYLANGDSQWVSRSLSKASERRISWNWVANGPCTNASMLKMT